MKAYNFYRFSGAAAIVSAALYLVSIVGMLAFFEGDLNDPLQFAGNMVRQSNMMLIYGWPGLFATVLIIPIVMTIHVNEKLRSLSRFVRTVTLIGLSFVLIGYLFQLALTYYISPMMLATATEQESFGLFIQGIIGIQDMFWLNGDLLAFLGIGVLLVFGLNSDQFPKWLSVIGLLSGMAAALGSFSFIPSLKESLLGLFFLAGFSVFALWEVIAGIYLLKTKN